MARQSIRFVIVLTLVLLVVFPTVIWAQREVMYEEVIRLSPDEPKFLRNVQNLTGGPFDFTVRGKVHGDLSQGGFRGFRVDFNIDTTGDLSYRDIQDKDVFVLRTTGLKCKIKILDYDVFVVKNDPLLGPLHWFKEIQLRITVYSVESS